MYCYGFKFHITVFPWNSHVTNFGTVSKNNNNYLERLLQTTLFSKYIVCMRLNFLIYFMQCNIFQQNEWMKKQIRRYAEFRDSNFVLLSQILKRFSKRWNNASLLILLFGFRTYSHSQKFANRVWIYYYYFKMNQ